MTQQSIKTKYCSVSFHEDYNGDDPFYWASVDFAWAEKDPPMARTFATLFDSQARDQARLVLKDVVEHPHKDVYLEDASLLINLKTEARHLAARLIGLIQKLEEEFDLEIERGKTMEVK